MSDKPKKAAGPLRLALGMIFGATAFYVFLRLTIGDIDQNWANALRTGSSSIR